MLGKSARLMLDALISGIHDPNVLAERAKGALRKKIPALREALHGRFTGHHELLIGQMLAHIDFLDLDETIATLSDLNASRSSRALSPVRSSCSTRSPASISAAEAPSRDRPRHEPLPDRRAPRLLGRDVLRSGVAFPLLGEHLPAKAQASSESSAIQ